MNSDPKPIRRLHESLVNRIAAGEIIHRPASALKELLENSLDAGSTTIKITVKDGGMRLLQIQDNGCGIQKSDLPILAERFTTSKISAFSDLSSLSTYGFRGEALASISHVANLTVITKTKQENCAWRASYLDGKLVAPQAGQTEEPKPCAGTDGTTLIIENLFYNTPTRLSALRSYNDEYTRILDVITKYAIHNPHVAFTCKKASSTTVSLSTPSNSSPDQAIRLLYGHSIAKELIKAQVNGSDDAYEDDLNSDSEREIQRPSKSTSSRRNGNKDSDWTADIYFTSANYQAKKLTFILFINHRLVESPRLKRALEAAYTAILPKGSSPFIYLSLLLPPHTVDVNVHPTKSSVHFLNEEAIMDKLADEVSRVLAERSTRSRDFNLGKQVQAILPESFVVRTNSEQETRSSRKRKGKERQNDEEDELEDEEDRESVTAVNASPISSGLQVTKPTYSQHKVRTSLKDRTLDSMFSTSNPSQIGHGSRSELGKTREDAIDADGGVPPDPGGNLEAVRAKEVKESKCYLTSVKSLRDGVQKAKHQSLMEIFSQHTFVGIVDLDKSLSLIQHSTKLYLVNHSIIAEEFFYQLGLRQFGDMARIKLQPSPSLEALLKIAVDAEEIPDESRQGQKPLTKSEIVQRIITILMSRREMLSEYFSLDISPEGQVEALPLLLQSYTPNLDKLPCFLMRLGPQVDWTSEKDCFSTFLRELAYFYVPGPTIHGDGGEDEEEMALRSQEVKAERWQIEHILFPSLRRYLVAPKSLLDTASVVQVASLPDLYKVFERC